MEKQEVTMINFQVQYFSKEAKEKLIATCNQKNVKLRDFLYHICINSEKIYDFLKKEGCIE